MNLHFMFYVPLFVIKLNNWNIKKVKLNSLYTTNSGLDEYINTDYGNTDYVSTLEEIFSEELDSCTKLLQINRLSVIEGWTEVADNNMYHKIHNHGGLGYSAIVYLDYDSKVHKPTIFISPFNNFLDGTVVEYIPEDIVEGTIIIFPSAIHHYTKPNTSTKPRKIISFNLKAEF